MKAKNILKGIIISAVSLAVGYFAIAIPFGIFSNFTSVGTRTFFIAELLVYFIVGGIFLIAKEKQEERDRKQQIRHERRAKQIEEVKENWYNIAA